MGWHPVAVVESGWNVMAHGDAREGKWRGNWRMEWVASTLHTTLEHGESSISTADAHTSAASSRLNWHPRQFKRTRPFRRKTKSGFCASRVRIYTQTTHRTKQLTTNWEGCGPCTVFASYTLAFALQLRHKHGKVSVRAAEEWQLARWNQNESEIPRKVQSQLSNRRQFLTKSKTKEEVPALWMIVWALQR